MGAAGWGRPVRFPSQGEHHDKLDAGRNPSARVGAGEGNRRADARGGAQARLQRREIAECGVQYRSETTCSLEAGDPRSLPEIYGPDVHEASNDVRPLPESESRNQTRRSISREASFRGRV